MNFTDTTVSPGPTQTGFFENVGTEVLTSGRQRALRPPPDDGPDVVADGEARGLNFSRHDQKSMLDRRKCGQSCRKLLTFAYCYTLVTSGAAIPGAAALGQGSALSAQGSPHLAFPDVRKGIAPLCPPSDI